MGLTKQQLEALNVSSFPNNTTGLITPEILRTYNSSSIEATVNQDVYTADSASFNTRINAITSSGGNVDTSSLVTTASFNAYTASQDFKNTTFATTSSVTALSQSLYFTDTTQSNNIVSNSSSIGLLQTFSGSQYKTDSASFDSRILAITGSGGSIYTGSFAITGSNTFTGSQTINGGNVTFGTTGSVATNGIQFANSSIYQNNFLNFATNGAIGIDFSANGGGSGNNINFRNTNIGGAVQFTTTDGTIKLVGGNAGIGGSGSQVSLTGSAVLIQNVDFIPFSSSVDSRILAITGSGGSTVGVITTGSATTASQTILGDFKFNTSYTASNPYTSQNGGSNVVYVSYGDIFNGTQSGDDFIYWLDTNFTGVTVSGTGITNGAITTYNYGSEVEVTITTGTITNGASYTFTGPAFQTIEVTGSIQATRPLRVVNPSGTKGELDGNGMYGRSADGNLQAGASWDSGVYSVNNSNGNFILFAASSSQVTNNSGATPFDTIQIAANQNNNGRFTQISFEGNNNYTNGRITVHQPLFVSQSLSVTGSATFSELTGSLGAFSASVSSRINNVSGSGGSIDTGSFATTGSNTFVDTQTLSGSKIVFNQTGSNNNGLAWNVGGSIYSDQNKLNFLGIEAGLDFSVGGTTSNDVQFRNTSPSGGIQFSANGGQLRLLSPGNSIEISGSGGTTIQGVNFTTYSSSVDSRLNTITNAGYATTASNAFTGQQTLTDVDRLNQITLDDHSGSLVLYGKGFTSSSLSHVTATSAGVGNIIFKTNNNTSTTIVSGSNNLFVNAGTPTTGFTRYIGGSGNIMLNASNVPQISSSMTISPTMNNNYFGGNNQTLTMRGPISSSAWTISANNVIGAINIGSNATLNAQGIQSGLTLTGNNVAGTLNVIANSQTLSSSVSITNTVLNGGATINAFSSSVTMANNNINDSGFTLNNNFFSSSAGVGQPALNRSTIGGQSNTITIQGGLPAGTTNVPSYSDNAIFGGSNILFADVSSARVVSTNAYHSAIRNVIGGNQLIISGSSLLGDSSTFGSAYFGRWNADDGIRNKTSDIVFAVGTGTSTTRKTGFLIDSGSNTFVEGTLNVSGSTSFTGSLTIQSGSGDLFVYGNKQFNVGAFQSSINQSGSAGVSQSMNFETTDKSEGVSIVSNSRITLANSGTYNIQFSAQILADSGADDVYIWLKKNGTNVAASAGHVVLANNEELIASWNYVVDAVANDYYEIVWQNTNGDAILLTETATGNIPSIPSVILTVTQAR